MILFNAVAHVIEFYCECVKEYSKKIKWPWETLECPDSCSSLNRVTSVFSSSDCVECLVNLTKRFTVK